jgi:uncharacterized RDD family membrane protein YckC
MRFPFPADEIVEPTQTDEAFPTIAQLAQPLEVVPEPELTSQAGEEIVEGPDSASAEPPGEAVSEPEQATTERLDLVLTSAPQPEAELEPRVDTVPRPRPKRKVIAFPSHRSVAPEVFYRLADPVTLESPRILDVPEELEAIPSTPFLDGLQLDPVTPGDSQSDREHVELPFRAASVPRRIAAGLVDGAVAGVAVVVFAGVAFRILGKPPITKPLMLAIVTAAGLLWSVYQYLFTVYAGKTLGMMAAKVCLRTFKGTVPTLRQRRLRVLGFYLSALSLGMGLMWMFVDVDTLCWHDRLSQTYLTDHQ